MTVLNRFFTCIRTQCTVTGASMIHACDMQCMYRWWSSQAFLQSCVRTLFLPLVAFVSCCPGRPLPLNLSLLLQACSSMHALLIALTPAALPSCSIAIYLAKLSRCCHGAVSLHCIARTRAVPVCISTLVILILYCLFAQLATTKPVCFCSHN
jgi:hypothetical protein